VVPHAGYIYSGPVAAYAYKGISGKSYDTVVIIGPSHRTRFRGISVYDVDRFETPLGAIPMDVDLNRRLISSSKKISYHPEAHDQEHSVEVQLPFLQKALGEFSLVMAVVGAQDSGAEEAFLNTLVRGRETRKTLLVASSDLSHYYDYEKARELDDLTLGFIKNLDSDGLLEAAMDRRCELCGILPVYMTMKYARMVGHTRVSLLHSASSGDTAGSKDQVVGYASLAFLPSKDELGEMDDDTLNQEEKERLLAIARETIARYLDEGRIPEVHEENPRLQQKMGAFVTIRKTDRLRGCIGNFTSTDPLFKTVQRMAVAAATEDPRFPPLTAPEVPEVDLEISALTPMWKASGAEEVEVGRHGLYIRHGQYSGVLLPQVATEQGWDRKTFLKQTCRKAGLPDDAWRKDAEIFLFEAQVFGEKD
jgi:AmmeMemoRadiSam system protein B/AmmeMemoRadiSam system protein A